MIREAREKLTHQTVLASIDFHAIALRRNGNTRSENKTLNDFIDIGLFHPFRNFT